MDFEGALNNRTEWLKTRQRFLAQIKRQVAQKVGPQPPDIATYVRRYNSEFSRPWKQSSHVELLAAVDRAQIVLGADFHAFSQSQRIHLRILRGLPRKRQVIIGLEALSSDHNKLVDSFLKGEISEARFLEKTMWAERWGFPFANYRPLFELAKSRGFRLVGISPKGRRPWGELRRRDDFAARIIQNWKKKDPEALFYVIVGDLHLAQGHLPRLVRKRLGREQSRLVTVLQNSEHLYFRLAKRRKEHSAEVMKSADGRYCVLSSPPWVKWQSYLMFLENSLDHQMEGEEADFTEFVASLTGFLCREFATENQTEDLTVVSPEIEEGWLGALGKMSKTERQFAHHLIRNGQSFNLPTSGFLFLARPSINHAAHLAGQYLHAQLCHLKRVTWIFPKDFEAQIWREAVGFFCSKLINHKRKSESLSEHKKRSPEAVRVALAQRLSEVEGSGRRPRFRPRRPESFLEAARIVGSIHGDRLYTLYTLGRLTLKDVLSEMKLDPLDPQFRGHHRRWLERRWRRSRRSANNDS